MTGPALLSVEQLSVDLFNITNNNVWTGPVNLTSNSSIGVDAGTSLGLIGGVTGSSTSFGITRKKGLVGRTVNLAIEAIAIPA